jgi:pectin methylesterase-like acyl-CoA thioesterase
MKNLSLTSPSVKIFSFLIILLFPLMVFAQLSGDIIIGSGETYTTITDAVNALNSSGFTGHLKFIIKDGTYDEQVEINEFANSDESNTITFTSQSGDSTSVILAYESGDANNYIMRLNGTDYITIEKITLWGASTNYTRAVDITGTAQNITIQNCELRSNAPVLAGAQNPALIYHDRANITDVTISNNYLVGGMGVYFLSHFSAPTQGVKILNNTFENGYGGVFLEYQNAPIIDQNIMINKGRRGCELVHCDGELEITNNKIEVQQSFALSLTYCYGGVPPFGESGLIANNFLTANGPDNSDAKGIVISACTYQGIYNNSVNIIGKSILYARALHLNAGDHNIIKNNIFANQHDGYACYVASPGQGTEIDYNNYYSPANFPYYWNERLYSLEEFKTASGMDTHSQEAYPNYSTDFDLHTMSPWLNNRGEYISRISEDIDGNTRSDPPDLGACEFTPVPGTTTPLSGIYEIGSNPYLTFQDAMDDLLLKGISGPVVFNISSGQYNEQLIIRDVPGSSDQNTVTFRSNSGNPDDVVLYYYDGGLDNNYVVQMKGADHWRFENMTFRSNTSPVTIYGRVFHLFAGTDDLMVDNCRLIGSPVNNSAADALAVVYSYHSVYNSRSFENTLFQHGSYGFYDRNYHSFPLETGLEVLNNEFTESYYAIDTDYHEAPKISGNLIHETDNTGIHVAHASGKIEIMNNQIFVVGNSAFYLESCDGSAARGLVANNFIHTGGTNTANGMRIYNTNNFDFYHNSVSVTSTSTLYGRSLFLTTAQNLNFVNNIFSNTGGGFVYYIDTPSAFSSSDYNDLYGTGAVLAKWNTTDYADLTALRSASGMEANSVSVNPQFVSTSDLHTSAAGLDAAGQHIASVLTDIDGQPRHPSTPDIGADEFMTGPNNPPTVRSHITDVDYPEDSGPHIRIVDLNTIFEDPDPGDYLAFSVQTDNPAITAAVSTPQLIINSQANYFGSANIIVTATDFAANTVQDTFLVIITPVNDPPVALDDMTSSGANHAFTIAVLGNDYDIDGDAITITAFSQGLHGSTSLNAGDTTITYTPQNGFFGADSFTYDISDGQGSSDQATVYITITTLFTEVNINIPDISHGLGLWVDYDMDGDLDILISGNDQSSNRLLRIYRNNDGSFSLISNIAGISPGNANAASWGDFDNDGDPDLLVTGYEDVSSRATKLYRNDINTFTEITTGIAGVSDGAVDWGDYDNDGDLDILLTGLDGSGNEMSRIYNNAGVGLENNWLFIPAMNIALPGIQKGSAVWGDYDNDMDLDILLSGQSGSRILRIYNNDNGAFSDANAGLTAVAGDADWGDYDNDGDLDILVGGIDQSLNERCDIYQNTDGVFANINAGIPGLSKGSAVWGDYDNDGDLDVCLTGTNSQNEPTTILYDNLGGNTFTEASVALPGIVYSSANWGDYDNDGRLDLLMTGYQYIEPNVFTALYKNAIPTINTPPTSPTLRTPQVTEASVTLSWDQANDSQTASSGLSYNLKIGEVSGGSQILSAMSNANGYRQIVDIGNTSMDTSWTINGLTSGRMYYWSVQAIDGAFSGSAFSEGYFSTESPYIEEIFTGIPGMMNGDYDNDGDLDLVIAGDVVDPGPARKCAIYNNDDGVFTEIEHDLPDANTVTLRWGDYDNDGDLDLFYSGAPPVGSEFVRIYQNNSGSFSDINANFGLLSTGQVSDAQWGDYDNDGDLDILLAGYYNSPQTKIFINTNGVFSADDAVLPGVLNGSVSWTDYDTDGDLDIFIMGSSPVNGIMSTLYKNNNGEFVDQNPGFTGAYYGSADWGDYDSDGDPDLLLTGIASINDILQPVSLLYRNDVSDGGGFTDTNTGFQGIIYGNATWGDFDNDGDLDILMAGTRTFGVDNEPFTAIYLNENNEFAMLDFYLTQLRNANASWADYDNDHDLDFLLMGVDENLAYVTKLFKNKIENPNSISATPAGLAAEASENALIFHWHPASDSETDSQALTYNLRIGTTPGGSEIKPAMSDSSGYRQIVKSGNAGMDTIWSLTSYDPGIFYYWSVQTVDNNFSGSAFANEHSFYSIPELEDVLVVTNNNNAGNGSLRQAIIDANSIAGLDTIVFAPNVRGTIELNSPLPPFTESLVILGPGSRLLSIDANQTGWVFKSMPSGRKFIYISGLKLTGGSLNGPGAGIYASGDSLVISKCVFQNNVNTSSENGGGAIAHVNVGSTVIYNSTIEGNRSNIGGAGIWAHSGKLFIMGSTINDNIVENGSSGGGGIYTTAETEIINSTISGNQHPGFGGGIYSNDRPLELKYVTITNNQANIGGGVYGYTSSNISAIHTIIGGNSATTSSPDIAGDLNSEGYNLIENSQGCLISGNTTGNILNADPMLFGLSNNGGLTKTHALESGSPAIDAGKPGAGIPNDQRGRQRPQDGDGDGQAVQDIGAIENMKDIDDDGMPDIEEAGPDGDNFAYDGNDDGTPDGTQPDVSSFFNFDRSTYITLEDLEGRPLKGILVIEFPEEDEDGGGNGGSGSHCIPYEGGLRCYPNGWMYWGYSTRGKSKDKNATEQISTFGTTSRLFFPQGTHPDVYTMYGPTPKIPYDHYFDFTYDGKTGAVIKGDTVTLHFIDGQRGDADLTANGEITVCMGAIGMITTAIGKTNEDLIPDKFELMQNYPNPFNPVTTIPFNLPEQSDVLLTVYNILGQKVITLVNENLPAGRYRHAWEIRNLASGIYIYRLRANEFVQARKMVILK